MPKGLRVQVPPRARFRLQRWIGFFEDDDRAIVEDTNNTAHPNLVSQRVEDNAFHQQLDLFVSFHFR